MNKKNIILRVDGNTKIGLGHIYRGIALAEMLKNDFEITFVIKQNSTISPVIDAGFIYEFLPEISYLEEPGWFKKNINNGSIIVCDGYEFKSEYQKSIKQQGFRLVYVDDLASWHMFADLVINHAIDIKPEDYSTEFYTKLALGTKYAILRPAFLEAAKQKRSIDKIDTAFVCFGGSDKNDLTLKTTKLLSKFENIKRINVVTGASYIDRGLSDFKAKGKELFIFNSLSDKEIVSIIRSSDVAIVPSSTILYEVCAVKSYIGCGFYVNNQKNIYLKGVRSKIFFPLDDISDINFEQLNNFLLSVHLYKDQLIKQGLLIDGQVEDRMKDRFQEL